MTIRIQFNGVPLDVEYMPIRSVRTVNGDDIMAIIAGSHHMTLEVLRLVREAHLKEHGDEL